MERVHAVSRCQHCSCKLVVTGLEELQKEQTFMAKHPEIHAALGNSTMGAGKLDESFIVLDPSKQARAGPSGPSNSTHQPMLRDKAKLAAKYAVALHT